MVDRAGQKITFDMLAEALSSGADNEDSLRQLDSPSKEPRITFDMLAEVLPQSTVTVAPGTQVDDPSQKTDPFYIAYPKAIIGAGANVLQGASGIAQNIGETPELKRQEIKDAIATLLRDGAPEPLPESKPAEHDTQDYGLIDKVLTQVGKGVKAGGKAVRWVRETEPAKATAVWSAKQRLKRALAPTDIGLEGKSVVLEPEVSPEIAALLKKGDNDSLQTAYQMLEENETKAKEQDNILYKGLASAGKKSGEFFGDISKKITPKTERGSLLYYGTSAVQGVLPSLGMGVAATVLTKNPSLGYGLMFGQVAGQTYNEEREAGRTTTQAAEKGFFNGITEVLSEGVPLGILTKEGGKLIPRLGKASTAEGIQEFINEAVQIGYDEGVLGKDTPPEEIGQRLWDAGIIGAIGGAGAAGAVHPFVSGQEKAEKLKKDVTDSIVENLRKGGKEREDALSAIENGLTEGFLSEEDVDKIKKDAAQEPEANTKNQEFIDNIKADFASGELTMDELKESLNSPEVEQLGIIDELTNLINTLESSAQPIEAQEEPLEETTLAQEQALWKERAKKLEDAARKRAQVKANQEAGILTEKPQEETAPSIGQEIAPEQPNLSTEAIAEETKPDGQGIKIEDLAEALVASEANEDVAGEPLTGKEQRLAKVGEKQEPLIEEAKKYKTADEFVEAQKKDRITTLQKKIDEIERINTKDISPKMGEAKIKQQAQLEKKIRNIRTGETTITGEDGKEYIVEDDKLASQLTDIWNKANAQPPTGKEQILAKVEEKKAEAGGEKKLWQMTREEYIDTLPKESQKILSKRFKHNSWYVGQKKTVSEALDEMAKTGDFYVSKKPSKVQSDRLFDPLIYDSVIKYSGKEGGIYKVTEEEIEYFLNRSEYWKENKITKQKEKGLEKIDLKETVRRFKSGNTFFQSEETIRDRYYDKEVQEKKILQGNVYQSVFNDELSKSNIETNNDFNDLKNKIDNRVSEIFGSNIAAIATGSYAFAEGKSLNDIKDDIRKALSEGKQIPPSVLKDYPDLVKQSKPLTGKEKILAKVAEKKQSKTDVESATKIEDFGEKIGGARKDYYALYADKIKEAKNVDVASVPLSKSWPEPNYTKLIEEGSDPWVVAFVRSARDEIPTKPTKSWKLQQWVSQVKMLRDVADKILSGTITKKVLQGKLEEKEYVYLKEKIGGRAELYETVGHEKSLKGISFNKRHWSLYEGEKNVDKWMVEKPRKATAFSNMPTMLGVGNTKEEAIEAFKAKYKSLGEVKKTKGVKFDLYTKRREKGTYIGKKIGKDYVDIKKFNSTKEAREYLKTHQAELEEKLSRYKEIPNERRVVNRERIGKDHRNGKDVTPDMFQETFGFRGVEFGNWVNTEERQDNLNRAYDALMDLSLILDIPSKAITLNGELGLAFGSRGIGGKQAPSAHYEPSKIVINLTKKKGPGSLAHEWWHALDNYFSRGRGGKDGYLTENSVEIKDDPTRLETLRAFKNIVDTLKKTDIIKRSRELDKRRTKDYWSKITEISARSFENYVIEKLSETGGVNDYLANIVSSGDYATKMIEGLMSGEISAIDMYPYLLESEIQPVTDAFDKLFDVIETKETDKGVALFSTKESKPETETEQLIEEAKKYDSVEEWVESFEYFRRTNTESPFRDVGYAMFSDDKESIAHYGKNLFVPNIIGEYNFVKVDEVAESFREQLLNPNNEDILDSYRQNTVDDDGDISLESFEETAQKLSEELDPEDIVDSAGVFDNMELFDIFWEAIEDKNIDGVYTSDGMIVFNEDAIIKESQLTDIYNKAHDKGDKKLSTQKPTKPQDTITKADLKKIFSGMQNITTGVNLKGNFTFRVGDKKAVEILEVDHINGYINTSSGRIPVGSFLKNTIELKTGGENVKADVATVFHEFTHYLETNGIINNNDVKALNVAIARFKGISERKVTEEDRADYVGNNLADWQKLKNFKVKMVLKKIADFMNAVYEFVSRTRTARGVLRDVESGKALGKKEAARPLGDSVNAMYQIVHHGTPHVWQPEKGFPHGRPRLDKIGSGEGAQAYGWGWYSADTEDVAGNYRKTLSLSKGYNRKVKEARRIALVEESLNATSGDKNKAKKYLQQKYKNTDQHYVEYRKNIKRAQDNFDQYVNFFDGKGAIYSLDIPDSVIPKLLDWDKRIGDRGTINKLIEKLKKVEPKRTSLFKELVKVHGEEKAKDFIGHIERKYEKAISKLNDFSKDEHLRGRELYMGLANVLGSKKEVSQLFASIGIPGLKYFDGMSRGKGEGSYNYVIWDQKVLDRIALLERNGEKLDAIREAQDSSQAKQFSTKPDTKKLTAAQKVLASARKTEKSKLDIAPSVTAKEGAKKWSDLWETKAYPVIRDKYGSVLKAVAQAMPEKVRRGFSEHGVSPEVKQAGRMASRKINELVQEGIKHVENIKTNVPEDQRELLYKVLDGRALPGRLAKISEPIRKDIIDWGKRLVDAEVLAPETYKKGLGTYLHRTIAKYESSHPIQSWLYKKHKLFEPQFKHRGHPPKQVAHGEVDKWLSGEKEEGIKWEILDVGKEKTTIWRDWTEKEREAHGEIMDAAHAVARTFEAMAKSVGYGEFFSELADNKDIVKDEWEPGMVQIPNSRITKGGTYKFGKLHGKYVSEGDYDYIMSTANAADPVFWKPLVDFWKKNKTYRNPGTHMNNTLQNIMWADFKDVPFKTILKAISEYKKGGVLFKEAEALDVFGHDVVTQDLRDAVEISAKETQKEGIGGIVDWTINHLMKVDDFAKRAYQAEDGVFRLALYMDRVSKGVPKEAAADEAIEAFIDYEINAPWVKKLRDTGVVPFISWPYKALPLMIDNAMRKPLKMAKWATIFYAANMIGQAIAGGDEDKERALLPEHMKGWSLFGPTAVKLPFKGKGGHSLYLDISRKIPFGDIFSLNLTQVGPFGFGGPVFMPFEMWLNKQAYTDKEIVTRGVDTVAEQLGKYAEYVWRGVMPNIPGLPYSYATSNILASAQSREDWLGRDQGVLGAALGGVGLKATPVNVEKQLYWKQKDYERDIRNLKSKISSAKFRQTATPESIKDAEDKYNKRIISRTIDWIAFLQDINARQPDSAIPEELKPTFVDEELRKLEQPSKEELKQGIKPLSIAPPSRHLIIRGESVELSQEQHDKYIDDAAARARKILSWKMKTSLWKNANRDKKEDIVKDVVLQSRSIVRKKLKTNFKRGG